METIVAIESFYSFFTSISNELIICNSMRLHLRAYGSIF